MNAMFENVMKVVSQEVKNLISSCQSGGCERCVLPISATGMMMMTATVWRALHLASVSLFLGHVRLLPKFPRMAITLIIPFHTLCHTCNTRQLAISLNSASLQVAHFLFFCSTFFFVFGASSCR